MPRLSQRIAYWHRNKQYVQVLLHWYDLSGKGLDGFPQYVKAEELRYPLTKPDMEIVKDLFRPDRQPPSE